MNKVILIGRLTRDPEVRVLSTGTAVANFSLAINRNFRNKEGSYKLAKTLLGIIYPSGNAIIATKFPLT